jgi:hypothetical protein
MQLQIQKTAQNTDYPPWTTMTFRIDSKTLTLPDNHFPICHFLKHTLSLSALMFNPSSLQCLIDNPNSPLVTAPQNTTFTVELEFKAIQPTENAVWVAKNQGNIAAIMAAKTSTHKPKLIILETTDQFFFTPYPSVFLENLLPPHVCASMSLLNDWGISNRLCCTAKERPGCYEHSAKRLADLYCADQPHLKQISWD